MGLLYWSPSAWCNLAVPEQRFHWTPTLHFACSCFLHTLPSLIHLIWARDSLPRWILNVSLGCITPTLYPCSLTFRDRLSRYCTILVHMDGGYLHEKATRRSEAWQIVLRYNKVLPSREVTDITHPEVMSPAQTQTLLTFFAIFFYYCPSFLRSYSLIVALPSNLPPPPSVIVVV